MFSSAVQPLVRARPPKSNPKKTHWATTINIYLAGKREESLYGGRGRGAWWNAGSRRRMGLEGGDDLSTEWTRMSIEPLHVCLIHANKTDISDTNHETRTDMKYT